MATSPTSSSSFDPQQMMAQALQGGMSSASATRAKSVVGELKFHFLTREAKTTVVPQLVRAINQVSRASEDTSLSPANLKVVYGASSQAMRATKDFYLRADELGPTRRNQTVDEITGRVNQLSDKMSNLPESKGFDAASDKVATEEEEESLGTAMDRYESKAEKALGVANLPKVEATFQEIETILAKSDDEIDSEELEIVFKKAVQAATVITGAIKATGKTVLDDSKQQTSSGFKSRLKARAMQAKSKLQAATLKVTQESTGKLKAVLDGSKVIQENVVRIQEQEAQAQEVEAKRKALLDKIVDSSPEKRELIAAAQAAYDNQHIPDEIKAHMQNTVIRALKLFPSSKTQPIRIAPEDKKMQSIHAQFTLDVFSFYLFTAVFFYDIFEKANKAVIANAHDPSKQREIIKLALEKKTSHTDDVVKIYILCVGIFRAYQADIEASLKSTGGIELYQSYVKENEKAQNKDAEGREAHGQFEKNRASILSSSVGPSQK